MQGICRKVKEMEYQKLQEVAACSFFEKLLSSQCSRQIESITQREGGNGRFQEKRIKWHEENQEEMKLIEEATKSRKRSKS